MKEYRGISYGAMSAHIAIAFARYKILSVAQPEHEEDRTICELCLTKWRTLYHYGSAGGCCNGVFSISPEPSWRNLSSDLFIVFFGICKKLWNGGILLYDHVLWAKILISQGANPALCVESLSYKLSVVSLAVINRSKCINILSG